VPWKERKLERPPERLELLMGQTGPPKEEEEGEEVEPGLEEELERILPSRLPPRPSTSSRIVS